MDFNNGKSRKLVKIIIGVFFALLILFGIFTLFIKPRLNKKEPVDINLADYVIVKTSGTNGSGKISPSLNKTDFVIDYEGQIYEEDSKKPIKARNFIESLDKNITYAISKENNLKNGDKVNIVINYPENIYNKFRINIRNTTFNYEVEGLSEDKPAGDNSDTKENDGEDKENKESETKQKEPDDKESKDKAKDYKAFIEDSFESSDTVELISVSYEGKIKRSDGEYFAYRINTRENLESEKKAFSYFLAVSETDNNKEIIASNFIHRISDGKDKKIYDISYDGFSMMDDLLAYLDDGSLELVDIEYSANFSPEDEVSGYYYPGTFTLFMGDDQNIRLENNNVLYTGSWQRKNGKIYLDIPTYRDTEIEATLDSEGLIFEGDVFN
ncbi:hypothetical protein [Anaerococcus prevotii]|uniref:Uncharacterized protein n=1 Tax=Anaerococcus prevotii ACS-065-V-Col13 TaxID=879305 RepID=F0GTP7_9FIRM|nr:hypothetical protein [Anaerococcus prevotii]EGC82837.1 hypothetical protein HMPREF9290_0970 [Anaerococcus prevotii ACS-065-V-Col13]